MRWSFWLSLSLSYLPIIGSMGNTVDCSPLSQPDEVIWQKRGQSASLPCTFSSNCRPFDIQWFAFKEKVHHQVNLTTTPAKYSLEGASLHIKSLNVNDSGIYHCAVVFSGTTASGAQMIGSGTTLVVRGEAKQVVWHTLMWLSFVLLAIYSLAVIVLIILKKNGHNIRICRGICTTHKSNSTKRMQFHAVVQELYGRRKLESSTQKARRNPSQNKAKSTQSNLPTDDIYQNL
ncbi:immunoglobulin superfamily member 6 [Centroberyx affinis]|uniref:immunoglobulin superfamily member 6 n=1 Tax=Centroberyx affinis TaxID=166261 RepID=UPI003A5C20D6